MIKSWKHKGLRLFFQRGDTSGIQVKHQSKLKIILQLLDAACQPEDLNLPGMRFHPLKGHYKDHYSKLLMVIGESFMLSMERMLF